MTLPVNNSGSPDTMALGIAVTKRTPLLWIPQEMSMSRDKATEQAVIPITRPSSTTPPGKNNGLYATMDRETHSTSDSPWLLTHRRMSMSRERATLITPPSSTYGPHSRRPQLARRPQQRQVPRQRQRFHQRRPVPRRAGQQGPDMPSTGVRMVGVYFPLNGKFYAVGGRSMDGVGNDFAHPFEYDPGSNTWTIKSAHLSLTTRSATWLAACSPTREQPYIYCVGGSAGGQSYWLLIACFRYNPVT